MLARSNPGLHMRSDRVFMQQRTRLRCLMRRSDALPVGDREDAADSKPRPA